MLKKLIEKRDHFREEVSRNPNAYWGRRLIIFLQGEDISDVTLTGPDGRKIPSDGKIYAEKYGGCGVYRIQCRLSLLLTLHGLG